MLKHNSKGKMNRVDSKHRKWSPEETFDLLSFYRELRVLWDPNNRDHGLKSKRAEAISVLAEKFNTTDVEINRKIHNLRCQFNGEVRKFNQKTGNSELKNCNSNWEFFEMMKDIMGYSNGKLHSNYTRNASTPMPFVYQQRNQIYGNPMSSLYGSSASSCPTPAPFEFPPDYISPEPKRFKYHHSDHRGNEDNGHVASTTEDSGNPVSLDIRINDEFQLFGDWLANELRYLKKDNQKIAKLRIQKIILDLGESELK